MTHHNHLIFAHGDSDGIVSSVLIELALGDRVYVSFTEPYILHETIKNIKSPPSKDVYFVDVALPSNKIRHKIIETLNDWSKNVNIYWIDHHKPSLYLKNKNVKLYYEENLCASEIIFKHLMPKNMKKEWQWLMRLGGINDRTITPTTTTESMNAAILDAYWRINNSYSDRRKIREMLLLGQRPNSIREALEAHALLEAKKKMMISRMPNFKYKENKKYELYIIRERSEVVDSIMGVIASIISNKMKKICVIAYPGQSNWIITARDSTDFNEDLRQTISKSIIYHGGSSGGHRGAVGGAINDIEKYAKSFPGRVVSDNNN